MKRTILTVAMFAVPSVAFGQTGTINGISRTINTADTINNKSTLNSKYDSGVPLPKHALEAGSKNDSHWTGNNIFLSMEEAIKLAAEIDKTFSNSSTPLALLAEQAKAEHAKALAANPSKTELIVTQNANGDIVYVRRARKK